MRSEFLRLGLNAKVNIDFSETSPTQGTLRVFPDVFLSNAYTILRPFFRPTVPIGSKDILDPKNWVFGL
jgi:hypothetical protein